MCQAIFNAYYDDTRHKEVIFDTNRMWTARIHQLIELFDDFKIICCVRNPAWVMDSFEKIYRKNPFNYSKIYEPQNRYTIYSHCESLVSGGNVGAAWTALKEAFYGKYSRETYYTHYFAGFPISLLYYFNKF